MPQYRIRVGPPRNRRPMRHPTALYTFSLARELSPNILKISYYVIAATDFCEATKKANGLSKTTGWNVLSVTRLNPKYVALQAHEDAKAGQPRADLAQVEDYRKAYALEAIALRQGLSLEESELLLPH